MIRECFNIVTHAQGNTPPRWVGKPPPMKKGFDVQLERCRECGTLYEIARIADKGYF